MKNTFRHKTDMNLVALIEELKKDSRENGAGIWRDIALRLEKPSNNWAEVNLSRLERYTNEGEIIVVPGKVLGAGAIKRRSRSQRSGSRKALPRPLRLLAVRA